MVRFIQDKELAIALAKSSRRGSSLPMSRLIKRTPPRVIMAKVTPEYKKQSLTGVLKSVIRKPQDKKENDVLQAFTQRILRKVQFQVQQNEQRAAAALSASASPTKPLPEDDYDYVTVAAPGTPIIIEAPLAVDPVPAMTLSPRLAREKNSPIKPIVSTPSPKLAKEKNSPIKPIVSVPSPKQVIEKVSPIKPMPTPSPKQVKEKNSPIQPIVAAPSPKLVKEKNSPIKPIVSVPSPKQVKEKISPIKPIVATPSPKQERGKESPIKPIVAAAPSPKPEKEKQSPIKAISTIPSPQQESEKNTPIKPITTPSPKQSREKNSPIKPIAATPSPKQQREKKSPAKPIVAAPTPEAVEEEEKEDVHPPSNNDEESADIDFSPPLPIEELIQFSDDSFNPQRAIEKALATTSKKQTQKRSSPKQVQQQTASKKKLSKSAKQAKLIESAPADIESPIESTVSSASSSSIAPADSSYSASQSLSPQKKAPPRTRKAIAKQSNSKASSSQKTKKASAKKKSAIQVPSDDSETNSNPSLTQPINYRGINKDLTIDDDDDEQEVTLLANQAQHQQQNKDKDDISSEQESTNDYEYEDIQNPMPTSTNFFQASAKKLNNLLPQAKESFSSTSNATSASFPQIFKNLAASLAQPKLQQYQHQESVQSSKKEIDIVFCVDTTSNMGPYLNATIDQIAAIYKKMQPFQEVIDVKYGFVCYRDHPPEENSYLYRISNLGSPLQTIQFIQKQEAAGGGDTPEAVMDGLYVAAAGINWRESSRKYIIHIADAPPHGDIYTGVQGGFLQRSFVWHDGCPCGLSIEKIARIMNSLDIHYRLIRAGDNMSRMAKIFKSCIEHYADLKVSSPNGLDFILSDMIAKQCLGVEDIQNDVQTSKSRSSYKGQTSSRRSTEHNNYIGKKYHHQQQQETHDFEVEDITETHRFGKSSRNAYPTTVVVDYEDIDVEIMPTRHRNLLKKQVVQQQQVYQRDRYYQEEPMMIEDDSIESNESFSLGKRGQIRRVY